MKKVSVITPIYNVEHFIAHCVVTLMQQTLDEVEYIFVNDATPDNSIRILKEALENFPEKLSQVKILTRIACSKKHGIKSCHRKIYFSLR